MSKRLHLGESDAGFDHPPVIDAIPQRSRPMFIDHVEASPSQEAIPLSDLISTPYDPLSIPGNHFRACFIKKRKASKPPRIVEHKQPSKNGKIHTSETGLGILVTTIIMNGNRDRILYLVRKNEEFFSFPRFDFKFNNETDAQHKSRIFGGFVSGKLGIPISDMAFVSKRDFPMASRGGRRTVGHFESRYLFTGQYDKSDFNSGGRRKVSSLRDERFDLHEGPIADLIPHFYRPLLIPLRYLIVGLLRRRENKNNPALIKAEQTIIQMYEGRQEAAVA